MNRFNTLAAQLEQIANLPDLPRRATDRALVLIAPPTIVQYEKNTEHTDDEQRLHQQAQAHKKAGTFTAQLLIAARNNWTITPATSVAEYQERAQQIEQGTTWIDGAFKHSM